MTDFSLTGAENRVSAGDDLVLSGLCTLGDRGVSEFNLKARTKHFDLIPRQQKLNIPRSIFYNI